jgi:IS605 OrfB family transposase
MIASKAAKIIRTDKWQLGPTASQKILMGETVKVYRDACRYLTTIISTHWPMLGSLSTDNAVTAVERLMHSTAKNPVVKYTQFTERFYKFPSYYRRAAISFALGQVSSYMTRYGEWVSGQSRKRRDAKPPILNPNAGCYPTLYAGQCYRIDGFGEISLKLFNGKEWIWTTVQVLGLRHRHEIPTNKMLSPSLIFNDRHCHLSVPFECKPEKTERSENVTAIDLGINTTATVIVATLCGTVIHREFIHLGRDIDRRDKRLKSVSMKAKKTMGTGGKLSKGFCSNIYRKCRNINQQIGHVVSKRIVEIAREYNSQAIVFEDLKGWKAKGGRKRSNLRQRFHGWLKSLIHDLASDKWAEHGGKTIDVVAAYTSKLAYDNSGTVKRDSKNYALATFANGRKYNADLNGASNIAARGIIKLIRRNGNQSRSSKSSRREPRSWVTLWDVWTLQSAS